MADVLDSNALRALGYVFAAGMCLLAGWREHLRMRSERQDLWPTFWYLSAVLLLVLAVGRVGLGDLLSDLGRRTAREEGWYQTRRKLQAAVVGSFAAAWGIAVLVAIWRVPERRRRYLPAAIVISGLVCFAAIRLVSLHQVDTVLYRRDFGGIHIVAIVETIGIAIVVLATLWNPFVLAPATVAPAESSVASGPTIRR